MALYKISIGSLLVALVAFQQSCAIDSIDQSQWKSIFCEANICYFEAEDDDIEPYQDLQNQLLQHEDSHYKQYAHRADIAHRDLVYHSDNFFPSFDENDIYHTYLDLGLFHVPNFVSIDLDHRTLILARNLQLRI